MAVIAIVSDTHVPTRATEIPKWVCEELRSVDHVVHAGDFDSRNAYRTVEECSPALTAVSGNMDPHGLDLPEIETLTLEDVSFVVTHGTGPVHNYRERVANVVRQHDREAIGISGHTHQVMDETVDGTRLLNPGSATAAAPATRETMMQATVEDGSCSVEVVEEP